MWRLVECCVARLYFVLDGLDPIGPSMIQSTFPIHMSVVSAYVAWSFNPFAEVTVGAWWRGRRLKITKWESYGAIVVDMVMAIANCARLLIGFVRRFARSLGIAMRKRAALDRSIIVCFGCPFKTQRMPILRSCLIR